MHNPLINFITGCDRIFEARNNSKLIIHCSNNKYQITHRSLSLTEWMDHHWFGNAVDRETQETVIHLKNLVGEGRLKRIFAKPDLGLDLSVLNDSNLFLTPEICHKIFIGLADITIEDLEERAALQGKKLNNLNGSEIDVLYCDLFPIQQIETIFEASCAKVENFDKSKTSGKGFKGLQERVWTIHQHAKSKVAETFSAEDRLALETEFLTSRLADREPPEGSVVKLSDGYYKVDKIFCAGGAHVGLYSKIGNEKQHLLICRGTAVRSTAAGGYLSGVNDLLFEMGALGAMKIWPELKQYLADHKIEKVGVLGKSLGGGHSQYLTVLIAGASSTTVTHLHTYGSVGAGRVQNIYNQSFRENDFEGDFPTYVFRNSGRETKGIDYIPTVGGSHLKTPKTAVYYVTNHTHDKLENGLPHPETVWQSVKAFFQSLSYAHPRQSTLSSFKLHRVEDIDTETLHGHRMEWLRMIGANLFNIATFGFFNRGDSFENFFHRERALWRNSQLTNPVNHH